MKHLIAALAQIAERKFYASPPSKAFKEVVAIAKQGLQLHEEDGRRIAIEAHGWSVIIFDQLSGEEPSWRLWKRGIMTYPEALRKRRELIDTGIREFHEIKLARVTEILEVTKVQGGLQSI